MPARKSTQASEVQGCTSALRNGEHQLRVISAPQRPPNTPLPSSGRLSSPSVAPSGGGDGRKEGFACLSPQGEFAKTPPGAPGRREARRAAAAGRAFLPTSLPRSKEVGRPPGRDPANGGWDGVTGVGGRLKSPLRFSFLAGWAARYSAVTACGKTSPATAPAPSPTPSPATGCGTKPPACAGAAPGLSP